MALTPSWPGPTGVATTTDGRKALAGLIVKDAAGNARAGVFPAHGNALVTARTDMNVDIQVFMGESVQFGGPILLTNDGVSQLPSVLVSPGAGTNFYVIYAKQNESTSPGTDANNNSVFGAQLSTTSFAAARAALPAGAVELSTVQMPTGKTATNQGGVTITATHQFTTVDGGTVWFRNNTERDLFTPSQGGLAYTLDSGVTWRYYGLYNVTTNPGGAAVAGWYPDGQDILTQVRLTANYALTTGPVALSWGAADTLSSGMWVIGTPTRLVLKHLGLWEVGYGMFTTAGDTKLFRTSVWLNGAELATIQDNGMGATGQTDPYANAVGIVIATAITDYVEVRVSTSVAGASVVAASARLWARYIGPARS